MRKRLPAVVLFLAVAISAQASIWGYFRDRGADFLDIFLLRVSAPRKAHALGFHARATGLAQLGGIYFEGEHFGMDRRAIGVWQERRKQGGVSLLFFSSVQNEVVWSNYFLQEDTPWMNFQDRGLIRNDVYWDDGRRHFLSLNAEVQFGVLPGMEVGAYPLELIDFAVGFLTMDPQNDDLERVKKYAPEYLMEVEPGDEQGMETLPGDLDILLEETEPLGIEEPETEVMQIEEKTEPSEKIGEETPPEEMAPKKEEPELEPPAEKEIEQPVAEGEEKKNPPEPRPAKLVTRDKEESRQEKPREEEKEKKRKVHSPVNVH